MASKIEKLKEDYKNKQPLLLNGTYVNSDDKTYENTYEKLMWLFYLEERYTNKKPLKYIYEKNQKKEEIYIGSTHEKYEEAYNTLKKQTPQKKVNHSNELNKEYIIFKQNGYINIVGDFDTDFVLDNISKLDSPILNEIDPNEIKGINLYNNLVYGKKNALNGLNITVDAETDGSLTINENIKLEHHNKKDNKDYRGLDIIPESEVKMDLENKAPNVPKDAKKIKKRKKAKLPLINKFKKLKKWQKAMVIAGIIALIGTGAFLLAPHMIDTLNNVFGQRTTAVDNVNVISGTQSVLNQTPNLDYNHIEAGHQVFNNAYDAVSNSNQLVANHWFNNNPVDVFNTATNQYMGLTKAQLTDPNFMAELAKDPNNAVLLGESIQEPSGFVNLNDVISSIKMK